MYRVLYVDDDTSLLDIGKLFIEQGGEFSIDIVASAQAAITLIESKNYDAIISDYQMPGMDGITFLKEIRSRFGNLPFILFTGKGREEVVIQAINNGADFYLQKGGDPKSQFAELMHKTTAAIERKRSERELREKEEKYRTILQTTRDGFWLIDVPSGRFTDVNETYCRMTGYSKTELLTLFISDIDAALTPAEQSAQIKKILAKGSDIFETRHRRKDGSIFDVELSVTYQNTDGGKLICFCRDITERKRAEEALKESEERFKLMFEQAPIAICITRDTDLLYANPALINLFGYSSLDEIVNLTPLKLFTPEFRPIIEENIRRRAEGFTVPNRYEAEYFRKDGIRFPAILNIVQIMFSDGLATVIFVVDMTECKMAEETLLEEKIFTDSIIDNLPGVFFVYDEQGNFVKGNDKFFKALGYTEEESRNFHLLGHISEEDLHIAETTVQEVYDKGQASVIVRAVTKDGRKIPFLVSGFAAKGKRYFVGIGFDISDPVKTKYELWADDEHTS